MLDKAYRLQEKRIQKYLPLWAGRLGLQNWNIAIKVVRGWMGDESEGIVATTHADWAYWKAQIEFSALEAEMSSDETLQRYIIHELLHVVLDEQAPINPTDDQIGHEEHVVVLLTHVIWDLYNMVPK